MYLWRRKHSVTAGTEPMQWARTVDKLRARVPGTMLRWRHNCWSRRGGGEGGNPRHHGSSPLASTAGLGPPSSAALSVSRPTSCGPSSSPCAGPAGTSPEMCRIVKIGRIVSTTKLRECDLI
jgi:hypothetical protein